MPSPELNMPRIARAWVLLELFLQLQRRQEVNNTQHAKTTLRPSWQIGRILFVK